MPNKTKFKVFSSCNDKNDKPFICQYDESYPGTIWCIDGDDFKFNYKIDYMRILNYEVELIEEQQDIDVQAIEEFNMDLDFNDIEKWEDELKIESKINELIQAVKQLDKKIREEK